MAGVEQEMRDYLVATQPIEQPRKRQLVFPGSLGDHGGRLYNTAMAIMILEVYYCHMPLYGNLVVRRR